MTIATAVEQDDFAALDLLRLAGAMRISRGLAEQDQRPRVRPAHPDNRIAEQLADDRGRHALADARMDRAVGGDGDIGGRLHQR